MRFAKGHGTQNDFVVLADLDAALALSPEAVSALCDRRRGLGADGVLRVTTAAAALAAGVFDRTPDGVSPDDWYMDYRNADGSIAQMCGNGVRVFAHYLRAGGLETRDEFVVGSLAGPRPVVMHHVDATYADVRVDMGKANRLGPGQVIVGGRTFKAWRSTSATHIWPASTLRSLLWSWGSWMSRRRSVSITTNSLTASTSRFSPRRSMAWSACAYTSGEWAKPVPVEREPSPPPSQRCRRAARPPAP